MYHDDRALSGGGRALSAGDDEPPRGTAAVRSAATAAVAFAVAATGLLGGASGELEAPRAAGDPPVEESAPAAGALGTTADHARRIVSLVNAHRERAGCAPLRVDDRVQAAAQAHADDMAARGFYAHKSPEGREGGDRLKAEGYAWSRWAENIHRGPRDPAATVSGWMGSAAHRENIVDCRLKDTGVGVSLKPNGPWWVQDFATGR
ncbi:CAP domain-containing protein [Streptomyces sp. NPDC015127]|uniref:CAP domain-containing protein n=1 Tax=Streptomyces sp. NPDC015127 TaxID=3364939 RepID=UPI0036F5C5B2